MKMIVYFRRFCQEHKRALTKRLWTIETFYCLCTYNRSNNTSWIEPTIRANDFLPPQMKTIEIFSRNQRNFWNHFQSSFHCCSVCVRFNGRMKLNNKIQPASTVLFFFFTSVDHKRHRIFNSKLGKGSTSLISQWELCFFLSSKMKKKKKTFTKFCPQRKTKRNMKFHCQNQTISMCARMNCYFLLKIGHWYGHETIH